MRDCREYNGNTLKFSIHIDNTNYIVKLPKKAIQHPYIMSI